MAWSPTGSVLATASGYDRALMLWDVSDPRRPRQRHRPLVTAGVAGFPWSRDPSFSPDGRVVAVNDYPERGWVTFVDVAHGRELRTAAVGGQIGQVTYSPDGKTVAAMTYPRTGSWSSTRQPAGSVPLAR